jgi:hypothetical protein
VELQTKPGASVERLRGIDDRPRDGNTRLTTIGSPPETGSRVSPIDETLTTHKSRVTLEKATVEVPASGYGKLAETSVVENRFIRIYTDYY